MLGGSFSFQDMLEAEEYEQQQERGKWGNLFGKLRKTYQDMDQAKEIAVVLRIKPRMGTYLNKLTHTTEELEASGRALAQLGIVVTPEVLIARYGLIPTEGTEDNRISCRVNKYQLDALKNDTEIAEVSEFHQDGPASDPEFSTLATSAYGAGVPGTAATGVAVATFEKGLTQSFLNCIGVSPASWDAHTGADSSEKRHSEATFKCLSIAAQGATFYHRRSVTYDGTNDQSFLVNNSIQTVSMSWARGGQTAYHSTYSEFLVMDDFAYRYPYPVFVNPTQNDGYGYEANWQCYNAINVGNVRHTNGSTFEMAECTQTKNPPPVYGSCISGSGSTCAGDRELPHVVAPGIPQTGTLFGTTCLTGSGTLACGTSYSAPILNGIAADVIHSDSRLVSWPEKVRAVILLTAQNVESGDWDISSDLRDGTGTVSGTEAISFASAHTSVSPGNTATEKGMGASSLAAGDFNGANKRFYFKCPNPKPAGKHFRAVLTWDSNPVVGGGVNALSDLDLIAQKNSGTAGSYRYDSNVEVVDIAAADLTAGSTYYLDISPCTNRIPNNSSTSYFYYAIAWEFVADHAP